MAAINTMSDEPPWETSGSGTPVTGSRASTTAMFTKACPEIHTTMPVARSAPYVSGARRAARRPRRAIAKKATMTVSMPRRPTSSPMTAKM